jgi:phospholipase/carboxylesterase
MPPGRSRTDTAAERGRLTARPLAADRPPDAPRGLHGLELGARRDGLVFVPQSYGPDRPMPLLVVLHGAGGEARQLMDLVAGRAEARGLLILSPDSRGRTWDAILGGFGPDVAFIDDALGHIFARYAVKPDRIAIGGFSDGASYALSLGITNGVLFSDILAFSPGFAAPDEAHGLPRIFISHGERDEVLPIERCSRRLVPRLRAGGYDVDYREFPDGHIVPDAMVDAALDRFLS